MLAVLLVLLLLPLQNQPWLTLLLESPLNLSCVLLSLVLCLLVFPTLSFCGLKKVHQSSLFNSFLSLLFSTDIHLLFCWKKIECFVCAQHHGSCWILGVSKTDTYTILKITQA